MIRWIISKVIDRNHWQKSLTKIIDRNRKQKLTKIQTIKNQKKSFVFVQISTIDIVIFVLFIVFDVNVEHLSAYMSFSERQIIMNRFNKKKSNLMMLILTYAITTIDLNLQNVLCVKGLNCKAIEASYRYSNVKPLSGELRLATNNCRDFRRRLKIAVKN